MITLAVIACGRAAGRQRRCAPGSGRVHVAQSAPNTWINQFARRRGGIHASVSERNVTLFDGESTVSVAFERLAQDMQVEGRVGVTEFPGIPAYTPRLAL
jgi:hypothetical protein